MRLLRVASAVICAFCAAACQQSPEAGAIGDRRSLEQEASQPVPFQRPERVPLIHLPNISGDSVPLIDPAVPYTVVQFGAAACGLCRQKLVDIVMLRDEVGATRMRAVVVVFDDDMRAVRSLVDSLPRDIVVLRDVERRVRRHVFMVGSPTFLVVDSSGAVLSYVLRLGQEPRPTSV